MNYSDYIDNLKELFGDDLIIKNNLIVGVCPCKGKGKGKCKGNGWQNFPFKDSNGNNINNFKSCPHLTKIENIKANPDGLA